MNKGFYYLVSLFLVSLFLSCSGGTNDKETKNTINENKNSSQFISNDKDRATIAYETITSSEHADESRTHLFDNAIFSGDFSNPSTNKTTSRVAPKNYPGAYNIITGSPDEIFIYFGVYGENKKATGPSIALLNSNTLEEVWRTQLAEFAPEMWNYPGVLTLHQNGNLYLVGGNLLAAIDPKTGQILNKVDLPSSNKNNSVYNGMATASDGTIFVKPLYRSCPEKGGNALLKCPDSSTPAILSAIDPNTLEVIAQVQVTEPVFGRLIIGQHNNEDYVYMSGAQSLFRYLWNRKTLSLDDNFGNIKVLKEGQIGTASPSITEDWLFFQTNGLPSSTTPMTVWAISTKNTQIRHSFQPFADLTEDQTFNVSMGSYDPENKRVYVSDAGVGYMASLSFDEENGFEKLWREKQTSIAYTMLINPKDERVFVATDLTGLGSKLNPFLAKREEVVFRNAANGLELARSDSFKRTNNGANLVPGYYGRIYFLSQDDKIYEITIDKKK